MNLRVASGLLLLSLTRLGIYADSPAFNSPAPAPSAAAEPHGGQSFSINAANKPSLQNLALRAEKELRGNILPFWLKYTRDVQHGGFHGLIDADMKVEGGAARGALLTSRILWAFSASYRIYHDPQYLEMARWAFRDLTENFTDKNSGGLFWTITTDGQPLQTLKQIYGQAFGIYALAEYYRATGEKAALEQAIALYRLVEKHAHDRQHSGYFDAFERDWTRFGNRQNPLGGSAPKSQNTHIHILEAYSALLRVWPDAELQENQRALIDVTIRHLIDPHTNHLVLFLREDWTPVSHEISYGHDIELSWLLVEAAEVLGDAAVIAQTKSVAVAIARTTLAEGVDQDGGVFNEGNSRGVTDTDKAWWPQAEAAIGFLNAYQLTTDARYFTAAKKSWDLIEAKFVDRTHGDWIDSVTRDGRPISRPKVTLWKCPYHNTRACLELIERVHLLTNEKTPVE